jgi:hypothetical protein
MHARVPENSRLTLPVLRMDTVGNSDASVRAKYTPPETLNQHHLRPLSILKGSTGAREHARRQPWDRENGQLEVPTASIRSTELPTVSDTVGEIDHAT